jgi:hypothetical protein
VSRALLVVAVLLVLAVAWTGGAGGAEPTAAAPTPEPGVTPDPGETPEPGEPPTPTPDPGPVSGGELVVGFTEPNPNLVWPAGAKDIAAPFDHWRDEIGAIRPAFYRLQLDWAQLEPDPAAPLVLDRAHSGCLRDRLPCAAWQGLREQLEALAARQAQGGWEAVVTISGTPEWAAEPPAGCERADAGPRARAPRADALVHYRALVTVVLALAAAAGAELRWWNAWNEPNHPYFLSPQRAECEVASPSVSVAAYMRLHAALGEALAAAAGDQERILGDLAGTRGPTIHLTDVQEFMRALPREAICGVRVWAQHAYLAPRDDAAVARQALAARDCPVPHAIWVTETGARNTPADPPPLRRCQSMHRRLQEWYLDPQVTVAFQYTLREDDRFPFGLITTALDGAYPALGLWQAWGGAARERPTSPAPSLAAACGA